MKPLPPTRIWLAILVIVMLAHNTTYSQHLSSARAIGMAASTSLAEGLNALDWNPAGLIRLKDWDLEATSFYPLKGTDRSVSFQMIGIGKRFVTDHAAALRLSPGSTLEFIVPSTFKFQNSTPPISFDKKISYLERYALGYAFRMGDYVTLGMSAHYLEQEVTDTRYSVDTSGGFHAAVVDYAGSAWVLDWGLLWLPDRLWQVGVVEKNLFRITETTIPTCHNRSGNQ